MLGPQPSYCPCHPIGVNEATLSSHDTTSLQHYYMTEVIIYATRRITSQAVRKTAQDNFF